MKSAPAIAFDFRPSRGIAMAITGMTLLAILAISLSGLSAPWTWLLAIMAFAHGSWSLHRHLRPGAVRIAHGEGGWLLVDSDGNESPVVLVDHAHPGFLLMLGFRMDGGPIQRFVLTPDNCDAELRRRLLLMIAANRELSAPNRAN